MRLPFFLIVVLIYEYNTIQFQAALGLTDYVLQEEGGETSVVFPPSTSISIYMCTTISQLLLLPVCMVYIAEFLTMIIYLLRFDISNSLQSEEDRRVINVLVDGEGRRAESSNQFKRGLLTLSKEAWSSSTMAGPSVAPIFGVETSA